MAVFDYWAYIFALILHAPVRLEAAVVMPPPEVLAAQRSWHAPAALPQSHGDTCGAVGDGTSVPVGTNRTAPPRLGAASMHRHPAVLNAPAHNTRGGR